MVLALHKAAFLAKRVNMVYQRRAMALTCKLFDLGSEDFFIHDSRLRKRCNISCSYIPKERMLCI